MHNETRALKLLDAFPLSSPSPPPPLSCPVFHRCGYSCALSIFLSSFSPRPFMLRFSGEAASLFHVTSTALDRLRYTCCCCCTPCKHTLCVTVPFPLSCFLFLSCVAMHLSPSLPSSPPLLILFSDIDVIALCHHSSLYFPLLPRLPLHSLLMLEPPGFLLQSLHLFNSLTFKPLHKFALSVR